MAEHAVVLQQQVATVVVEVLRTQVVEVQAQPVTVEQSGSDVLVVQQGGTALAMGMQPGALVVQPVMATAVVAVGIQGPPGPPGAIGPAGGSAMQRRAGHTISALRVVWEDERGAVHYLQPGDEEHIFCLLGVTLTAANEGDSVNVQRSGVLDDSNWSWVSGQRVYLGADGALTPQPVEQGFHVLIGTAASPTRLLLNVQDPVMLGDMEEGA